MTQSKRERATCSRSWVLEFCFFFSLNEMWREIVGQLHKTGVAVMLLRFHDCRLSLGFSEKGCSLHFIYPRRSVITDKTLLACMWKESVDRDRWDETNHLLNQASLLSRTKTKDNYNYNVEVRWMIITMYLWIYNNCIIIIEINVSNSKLGDPMSLHTRSDWRTRQKMI